jgi:23S rRNA-/tRNA-specific pseudouridylate synthase
MEAMPETETLVCDRAIRLDAFVTAGTDLSRTQAQRLIRAGAITVNDEAAKPNVVLSVGDRVTIARPDPVETEVLPENIPLDILYEDADLLVVDKPQGMVVHPAPGHAGGTLVNALLYHVDDLSGIGGELRPGIVHRIDRMTSGLLVVAKNDAAHRALSSSSAITQRTGAMPRWWTETSGRTRAPSTRRLRGTRSTERKWRSVPTAGKRSRTGKLPTGWGNTRFCRSSWKRAGRTRSACTWHRFNIR